MGMFYLIHRKTPNDVILNWRERIVFIINITDYLSQQKRKIRDRKAPTVLSPSSPSEHVVGFIPVSSLEICWKQLFHSGVRTDWKVLPGTLSHVRLAHSPSGK